MEKTSLVLFLLYHTETEQIKRFNIWKKKFKLALPRQSTLSNVSFVFPAIPKGI